MGKPINGRRLMRYSTWCANLFGIALLLIISVGSAQAQATRTWVSGVGDDANPCSRTAPCKTLAGAMPKTAVGGEIDVLDPNSMGAVTINKSITIDGSGGSIAGMIAPAGANGITVNDLGAGTISVTLRNLDMEGTGFTAIPTGVRGISFVSGAALHVENCIIRNFRDATNGNGISFTPSTAAKLFVSDTILSGNGTGASNGGILIKPTGTGSAKVSITRTNADNNNLGIRADASGGTGAVNVTIIDSGVSGNSAAGFAAFTAAGGGPVAMTIMHSQSSNNGTGVNANGAGAIIRIGSSIVTGNATGVAIQNSATMTSFGTNEINDNPTPGPVIPVVGPT
jgi:hypothetical protein